jgi:tRNA A-37 threonylcarbamoyl transferase component Bud32
MQSSMLHFCEECGAANAEDAVTCAACQRPLSTLTGAMPAPTPVAPVKIASTATLQVVAGASAPAASGPLAPGTVLEGRYRILREIGQGGFGSVYQARDLQRRGRLVAIKQIDLGLLKPRQIIEATDAFNREITFLSTLSHPHLPKIFGHFTDASHWYLVMQYIKGQTLEECIQQSRHGYLPTNQVLKIGQALTDVLGYLHSRRPPVIFRDLKPANIMLTPGGHVYLIDFGIARRFAPEKARDTGPLGSPGYAAPEQYGHAQTDARTDIYGLGATLQTLFTGRDPLELRQGLPSRSTKPLPEELQALIDSMLEADPAKRPAHVSEIEERFAWWSRRALDLFAVARGAFIGLFFWVWYGLLALGVNIIQHTDFSHVAATPFKVRLFLVVLNLFPLAVIGTIIYQIFLLVRQKRQQQAILALIILAVMLLFALIGWLPALFHGYPFHTYNPDLLP